MTELARRRAFLGAAALVGAAAVVPAFSSSPRRDDGQPATGDRPMVLAVGGASSFAPSRRSVGSRSRGGKRTSLARARERAHAFARAFLRYQLGDDGPRTRAALARTASAALTRYLVASPARPIDTARHAELVSLRLYARGRSEAKASALLRYGGRLALFEFRLRRGRPGWRVAELYR